MGGILPLIARHGYILVFGTVLAEALGFPMPAALALVAAGAGVASGKLSAPIVGLAAVAGMILGDCLLFVLGRNMGWTLLGALCRLSMNPETCILNSAESFYKRGKLTLVLAKFIPGINAMAAPLAGSMNMRTSQFLRLDLAGISLYVLAYTTLGFLFRDFLVSIIHGLQVAGRVFEGILLAALVAYIVYRVRIYRSGAPYRVVPRVQVAELARKLASEEKDKIIIADVRSHGYYESYAARIHGAIRIEPNNLLEEIKNLPKDKDIYLYCT
jgi:membrane protein DedA with SNARE-associated domain